MVCVCGWSKDNSGEYWETRGAFISSLRLVKEGWRTERALYTLPIVPVEQVLKFETVHGV